MVVKKVIGRLVKRALERKVEAAIGAATAATGTAAIVEPALLELIPENVRGYAVLAVVLVLCARALKGEITEAIKAARDGE